MPLGVGLQHRDEARGAIPRIIHQTYPTKRLPVEFERAVESVRHLNPGWEHRLYDDDDIETFIGGAYPPEVLDCYRRITPAYGAARVDLFRYLLLFRCGGVYLDIKTRVERPLDDVLREDDTFVSSHWDRQVGTPHSTFGHHAELAWHPPGELQQWHIIVAAGHPFLEAVVRRVLRNIEQYNPFWFGVGKMGVIRLTGPIPYTEAIVPMLPVHTHRIVATEAELGLGYSIFSDGGQHKNLFRDHYSQLETPIVRVSQLVAQPYRALHAAKQLGLAAREHAYRLWRIYRKLRPAPAADPGEPLSAHHGS